MNMIELTKKNINKAIALNSTLLLNANIFINLQEISEEIIVALKNGNKILFCGNGGSAADAQHLAAEFSGRFYFDREPLFAEALHVNTSYLTAVANDYSYDQVFARLVKAKGRKGDILVGLSTSGNSNNIVEAFKVANQIGVKCFGFTGEGGGKMKNECEICIEIPSKDTPRIQEMHMLLGHTICEYVEKEIFNRNV